MVTTGLSVLPYDILPQVFAYCLPTTHDYVRQDCFPLAKWAPILLMHTCRHWREITLSTPSLWAVLYLGTRSADESTCSRLKTILEIWEVRSNREMMTLSIQFQPPAPESKLPKKRLLSRCMQRGKGRADQRHQFGLVNGFNEAWFSIAPRFRILLFHCHRLEIGVAPQLVLAFVEGSDSIKELVILNANQPDELLESLPHPSLEPSRFARLSVLECNLVSNKGCTCVPRSILQENSTITNIRKLALRDFIWLNEWVMLLQNAPVLCDLEVVVSLPTLFQILPQDRSVCRSNLQRLSLKIENHLLEPLTVEFHNVLRDLKFPLLKEFHLSLPSRFPGQSNEQVVGSIADVLRWSRSPITNLHLHWYRQQTCSFAKMLESTPYLRHLHLIQLRSHSIPSIIETLASCTESRSEEGGRAHVEVRHDHCPMLESVTLDGIEWPTSTLKKFAVDLRGLVSNRFGKGDRHGIVASSPFSKLVIVHRKNPILRKEARSLLYMITSDNNVKQLQQLGLELIAIEKDRGTEH